MKKKKKRIRPNGANDSRSDASTNAVTVFGRAVVDGGAAYNSAPVKTTRPGLNLTDTVAGAVLLWRQEALRHGAIPSSCFVVRGERAHDVASHSDYLAAHRTFKRDVVGTWGDLEHDLATDDGHTTFDEDVRRLENLREPFVVRMMGGKGERAPPRRR